MTTGQSSTNLELKDNNVAPMTSTPPHESVASVDEAPVEGEDSIIEIDCDSVEHHGRIPSDESFELANHHDLSPLVSPSTTYLNTRRSSASSILDKKLDSGNGQTDPDTPTRASRRRSSTLVSSPGSPEVRRSIYQDSEATTTDEENSSEEGIASLSIQPHPISALRTTARIANQSRQIFRPAAIVPRPPPLRSKNPSYPALGHRHVSSSISRSAGPLSPIPDTAEPNLDPTANTFQPVAASSPFSDNASYEAIVESGKNAIGDLTKSARDALLRRGLKPIPALHGPLTLPYARCPSGIDAFLFSPEKDLDPWTFVMEPDDLNRKAPNRRHVSVPLPGNARYSQPSHIKSGRIPGLDGGSVGNRIVSAPAALNKGKFVERDRSSSGRMYEKEDTGPSTQRPVHEGVEAYRPFVNYAPSDDTRGPEPIVDSFAAVKVAAYAAGFGQGLGEMQPQFGNFPPHGIPPWSAVLPYSFYPPAIYPPYMPQPHYANQFAEMSYNHNPQQSLDSSPYFDPAIVSIGPAGGLATRQDTAQHYAQQSEEECESRSEHEHDGFYFPSPPQRRSRRTATVKPSHQSSVPHQIQRNRSADAFSNQNARRPTIPFAPAPPLPNHIVPHSPERRYSAAPAILHGPRKNQPIIPTITFIKPSPRRMSVATTGMRRGLDLLDKMSMQHHQEKAKKKQLAADGGVSETSSTSTAIRMPRGPPPLSSHSTGTSVGSGGAKSRQHSRSNSATSAGKSFTGRSSSSSFVGSSGPAGGASQQGGWTGTSEGEQEGVSSSTTKAGSTQRHSGHSRGSWRSRGKPRTPATAQ